jgi:cysteine-rich repeat protein
MVSLLLSTLLAAWGTAHAQPLLCDPEPSGSDPRPRWGDLAPPSGSGYPDYVAISHNLQVLNSLTLLASVATRAAESLQDLSSEVEAPESQGRCICCPSLSCAPIQTSTRKDCTPAACPQLGGPDYPIWLPNDVFKDPANAARFALKYLKFLDDIQKTLGDLAQSLQALGTGIEDYQNLLATYLAYVDTFTEGFHLGGYSTERPDLHLCVGYGGHGAFAEMLDLFGEISIGGRYTSQNLSIDDRAQFRSGGFGVSAFGRTISLLPGIEANLQIDGFKLWNAAQPFGVDLGIAGDANCADGAGFRITDLDRYDIFHLVDSAADLTPFDTSGDGCLQPGEFLIRDFYPASYLSTLTWPRPAAPYDWESRNTAVVAAGLNLPLHLQPIEKLIPPTGIVLFPGATLFPKLTLKAGTEWTLQANQLRARLQDAINQHLPAAGQLGPGDFERPMHSLQAPDVSEDDGNSAFVQPRVAADLVLGIALSRYLTLGITASVGTSVRVEPAAHGGVVDLNVALASSLLHSNPPPNLPCDPTIEVTERTICSNGLLQSFDPETDAAPTPQSNVTYTCDTSAPTIYHCADPEQDRTCTPRHAMRDCPTSGKCIAAHGCAAFGSCERVFGPGPDGLEGTEDDVVSVEYDTTYDACVGNAVCDDAALNHGAPCDADDDCVGPQQCVGGDNPGRPCALDADCRGGSCAYPTAPCVTYSPVGYFTPYQCLVRQEPAITGWHGPGCHPLTVGFASACGCAGDADCVDGQEICADGVCSAGQAIACSCDPAAPSPCSAGRVCREGACLLDCSAHGDADCATGQTCSNGACVNPYGIPFAQQIVWQTKHVPKPQHAVASYALSDILASAILDAGMRLGLDLKIFKKLYHFDIVDLRDYWPLFALNKSWYQPGLEAQYQNDCDAVAGDTVSNWQPGADRVTRYNPFAAANGSYGNAGTLADLRQWCLGALPQDVSDPHATDGSDLADSAADLLDWGEQIGSDVWALGALCVRQRGGGTVTEAPLTDWLHGLDAKPGALPCTYTYQSQTYAFPCAQLPDQLLRVWGCLDTDANPFAASLANIPGIVTSFNGTPVFDLGAMLTDPTAQFTLDNLDPAIRGHAFNAGVFWYAAVTQCFEQHYAAVRPGEVTLGAIQVSPCCGNGVLDRSGCAQGEGVPPCEACDDGNTRAGDGCSPLCRIEGRVRPLGSCGNGLLEKQDLEECDDGNATPGDGCEPNCRLTAPTPTPRASSSPTPTRTRRICVGDCDADQRVAIAELIRGVGMALGLAPPSSCPALDADSDGRVTVDELVRAVAAALGGCESPTERR